MFRRRTSQKPSEEFYMSFKATFPRLAPSSTMSDPPPTTAHMGDTMNTTSDMSFGNSHFDLHDDRQSHVFTPCDYAADFKSIFDNYPPQNEDYWASFTPSNSGLYSNQIMSTSRGTPLSRPASEPAIRPPHSRAFTMQDFETSNAHELQNFHRDGQQQAYQSDHHGHISHFERISQPQATHGLTDTDTEFRLREHASTFPYQEPCYDVGLATSKSPRPRNQFRFCVTLNAPTAMIKHPDEIPITYLNKCQTYTLSVKDTMFDRNMPCQYRTFVRVSFEDQVQRSKPLSCWELWRDTRGKKEAHQRGGKLQAVEYVPPSQGRIDERGSAMELAADPSPDGFCVLWTPTQPNVAECSVSVRFNFLSTDFSHSKGVKGIPLRLCAKTEVIGPQTTFSPMSLNMPEICHCTIKLFRDHGAERKLSNDISHVKKMVEKLNQQIIQQDTGATENGKRRRSDSGSRLNANSRPNKVLKNKRSWSVSSASSDAGQESSEMDLSAKVALYEAMFTSTRPVSVLFLRGDEQDDPDLHPVQILAPKQDLGPGSAEQPLRLERQDTMKTSTSRGESPVPSLVSCQSPRRRTAAIINLTPIDPPSRLPSNEWPGSMKQMWKPDLRSSNPQHLASPPDGPTRIHKLQTDHDGDTKEWIETLDFDQNYQAPPEAAFKPLACFYARISIVGKRVEDGYYRALYLRSRTEADLVTAIAVKCNIMPAAVIQTVRVLENGLRVKVDDDVVAQIPEGQDMLAELDIGDTDSKLAEVADWAVDIKPAICNTDLNDGYRLTLRY